MWKRDKQGKAHFVLPKGKASVCGYYQPWTEDANLNNDKRCGRCKNLIAGFKLDEKKQ